MDIRDAIVLRHSVRQYKDKALEPDIRDRLTALVGQCNEAGGLNIQLVCDEPECFDTFLAHYGRFTNVKNYIAMIGSVKFDDLDERVGYYGQKLVLEAQMMGLNSCWVAGTYGKGKCRASVSADERIVCVIAIGYGENNGTVHRSKPVEKICRVPESQMPDWFKDGVEAALLAPTAINQQKFQITLEDGEPVITAKMGAMTHIDLGIVKYNFEAASGHKCK